MARYQVTDSANSRFLHMKNMGIIDYETKKVKSGRQERTIIVDGSMRILTHFVDDEITIAKRRLAEYLEKKANGNKRMGLNIEIEEYIINTLTNAKR